MRIAHFIQRYPPARGGSEAYFQRLSRYLVNAGNDVDVWTTTARDLAAFWSPSGECYPADTEDDAGVTVRRFPLWRMHGRRWLLKPLSLVPLRAWQALTLPCNPISVRMWREAGRCEDPYDAVHASAFPYAWPIACALRLARRQGIPFFLTPFLHLGDPTDPFDRTRLAYTQPALRRFLRLADRVFVQTELERDAVIELGVPPDRAILQGLGVDPSECTGGDRQRARAGWGVDDEVVIGHLANLSVEKGTIDLVQAVERMNWPATLVLAGPAMPNFQRFMANRTTTARIVQLGELSDTAKRDFFAGIDIFALPSRSDSFGLVLLEAWANSVPNVAYRAGGPGELIRDGVDGLLAKCGDVAALTECLDRLVRDQRVATRWGDAGRQRLPSEFAWSDKLDLVRSELAVTSRRAKTNVNDCTQNTC